MNIGTREYIFFGVVLFLVLYYFISYRKTKNMSSPHDINKEKNIEKNKGHIKKVHFEENHGQDSFTDLESFNMNTSDDKIDDKSNDNDLLDSFLES